MSESEDNEMSEDETEEEEDYASEVEDSEDDSADTSDDEGTSGGTESDKGGVDKRRKEKENAKKSDVKPEVRKRKASDEKMKKKSKKSKISETDDGQKAKKTKVEASTSMKKDKKKKLVKKPADDEAEVQADPIKALEEQSKNESKDDLSKITGEKSRNSKNQYPEFSVKNIDYNLVKNSSHTVVQRSCQISDSIICMCKNIEILSGGAANGHSYDYASLTFCRKSKNGKAFEFNMPLQLAPTIIEAIQNIIKDNEKFFASART